MLERLRDAGVRLGVVTSKKRQPCLMTTDDLDFTQFFHAIVTEEDTAPRIKPLPDPLLLAAAQLGVAPERCLYVGDNPDDIIAAHAAGMRAVAVGWTLRPREELLALNPEAIIETAGELLELFSLTA